MSRDLQKFVGGAFGLIGLFLVLEHYTGAGKVIGALGQSGGTIIKDLQGR